MNLACSIHVFFIRNGFCIYFSRILVNGVGKFHPIICPEGMEGRLRYSSTHTQPWCHEGVGG